MLTSDWQQFHLVGRAIAHGAQVYRRSSRRKSGPRADGANAAGYGLRASGQQAQIRDKDLCRPWVPTFVGMSGVRSACICDSPARVGRGAGVGGGSAFSGAAVPAAPEQLGNDSRRTKPVNAYISLGMAASRRCMSLSATWKKTNVTPAECSSVSNFGNPDDVNRFRATASSPALTVIRADGFAGTIP